jgi:hypothetical protein
MRERRKSSVADPDILAEQWLNRLFRHGERAGSHELGTSETKRAPKVNQTSGAHSRRGGDPKCMLSRRR